MSKAIKRLELRTARILEEGEAVEAEARATSAAPRGRVRLAAPMSLGLQHVAPILPAFMQADPEIAIDLQLDDRVVDIVAVGIDVALRIAELPDSSLVARRLCPVRGLLLAAPTYVASRAMPRRPGDLRDHHPCLTYSYLASGRSWRFLDAAGQEASVVATLAGGPRPPRVAVLLDFLGGRFGAHAAPWSEGRT